MKKFISASGTNFFHFFQTLIRMEAVFRSSEMYFINESFILASGKLISVNYKTLCI